MMPAQPYGEPVPADLGTSSVPVPVVVNVPAEQQQPPAPEPIVQAADAAPVVVDFPGPSSVEPAAVVPPAELPPVGALRFYTRYDPFSSPARDRVYAVLVVGVHDDGSVRGLVLGTVDDAGSFQPGELTS